MEYSILCLWLSLVLSILACAGETRVDIEYESKEKDSSEVEGYLENDVKKRYGKREVSKKRSGQGQVIELLEGIIDKLKTNQGATEVKIIEHDTSLLSSKPSSETVQGR